MFHGPFKLFDVTLLEPSPPPDKSYLHKVIAIGDCAELPARTVFSQHTQLRHPGVGAFWHSPIAKAPDKFYLPFSMTCVSECLVTDSILKANKNCFLWVLHVHRVLAVGTCCGDGIAACVTHMQQQPPPKIETADLESDESSEAVHRQLVSMAKFHTIRTREFAHGPES